MYNFIETYFWSFLLTGIASVWTSGSWSAEEVGDSSQAVKKIKHPEYNFTEKKMKTLNNDKFQFN